MSSDETTNELVWEFRFKSILELSYAVLGISYFSFYSIISWLESIEFY